MAATTRDVYYLYETGESFVNERFDTNEEAQQAKRKANRDWRKAAGGIWILWWLLRGFRMKYAVRRDLYTEYDEGEES